LSAGNFFILIDACKNNYVDGEYGMSAYVIVEIEVSDPAKYEEYKKLAFSSVTAHGGKYVVRGGSSDTLEGDWSPKRIVVLEFESMARARDWYQSPDYQEAKLIRLQSSTANMICVEGTV
jgi:uncharacterized protein (DUF1330 family)